MFYAWYFMETSLASKFACNQCLLILCVFLYTNNTVALGVPLPHEDCLGKIKTSYIKSAYCSICDDCGVIEHEIRMNRVWF